MALPQPTQSEVQALMALLQAGKFAEAEDKSRHYTKKYPKILGFYDLLSKAQIAQEDYSGVVRTLKKALKIKPEYVDGEYNLGVAYMALGKTPEAISCFLNVAEKKPDFFKAYNNLGACYIKQEDIEKGLEFYRKSYEVQPDFAPTLLMLGVKLREHGESKKSEEYLEKLTALQPEFAVGHYSLGLTKVNLKKDNEAVESFNIALKLNPDLKEAKEELEKLKT